MIVLTPSGSQRLLTLSDRQDLRLGRQQWLQRLLGPLGI